MTPTVIRVSDDGSLVIPAEVIRQFDFTPGQQMEVGAVDGVLVITSALASLQSAALEIERARIEAGISMEEMFAALREDRERSYNERHGSSPS